MWSPATRLKPPSDRTLRPLYSTISTQFVFRFETLGATRCRARPGRRHNIWWNYGNVITRMSGARVKGRRQENRFNLQAFVNEVTNPLGPTGWIESPISSARALAKTEVRHPRGDSGGFWLLGAALSRSSPRTGPSCPITGHGCPKFSRASGPKASYFFAMRALRWPGAQENAGAALGSPAVSSDRRNAVDCAACEIVVVFQRTVARARSGTGVPVSCDHRCVAAARVRVLP